jgi:hypothetical protein
LNRRWRFCLLAVRSRGKRIRWKTRGGAGRHRKRESDRDPILESWRPLPLTNRLLRGKVKVRPHTPEHAGRNRVALWIDSDFQNGDSVRNRRRDSRHVRLDTPQNSWPCSRKPHGRPLGPGAAWLFGRTRPRNDGRKGSRTLGEGTSEASEDDHGSYSVRDSHDVLDTAGVRYSGRLSGP